MEVAHISSWRRDPRRFWAFYGTRFATLEGKQPNGAHRALAQLGIPVITQNIDGLHAAAGSQDVIEVHGSIASASCLSCGAGYPLAETRARLEAAEDGVPRCDCGRPLKPDVVLFGELLDEAAMNRASALAAAADPDALHRLLARGLAGRRAAGDHPDGGGAVAIVTKSATPYDGYATVRLDGDVRRRARGRAGGAARVPANVNGLH